MAFAQLLEALLSSLGVMIKFALIAGKNDSSKASEPSISLLTIRSFTLFPLRLQIRKFIVFSSAGSWEGRVWGEQWSPRPSFPPPHFITNLPGYKARINSRDIPFHLSHQSIALIPNENVILTTRRLNTVTASINQCSYYDS